RPAHAGGHGVTLWRRDRAAGFGNGEALGRTHGDGPGGRRGGPRPAIHPHQRHAGGRACWHRDPRGGRAVVISSPINLVIFDCDGGLVDSERIAKEVLAQVLGEHGVVLAWQDAQATFMGKSTGQIAARVAERFDVELPADWTAAYYGRMIPALAERVEAIDG